MIWGTTFKWSNSSQNGTECIPKSTASFNTKSIEIRSWSNITVNGYVSLPWPHISIWKYFSNTPGLCLHPSCLSRKGKAIHDWRVREKEPGLHFSCRSTLPWPECKIHAPWLLSAAWGKSSVVQLCNEEGECIWIRGEVFTKSWSLILRHNLLSIISKNNLIFICLLLDWFQIQIRLSLRNIVLGKKLHHIIRVVLYVKFCAFMTLWILLGPFNLISHWHLKFNECKINFSFPQTRLFSQYHCTSKAQLSLHLSIFKRRKVPKW